MSLNRENVIWQSCPQTAGGTWNIGFFDFSVTGVDEEWDVDYDYGRFEWVSVGHATRDDAFRAYVGHRPSPGHHKVIDHDPVLSEKYDRMAKDCAEQEAWLNRRTSPKAPHR